MNRFSSTLVFAVTLIGACACGYREGPPVMAPPSVVPPAAARLLAEAPADRPAIVLEANGDAAKVSEVFTTNTGAPNGTLAQVETLKPLCIAPCRVDLPPGLHELRFSSKTDARAGSVDLTVDEQSKVVRHSMGSSSGSPGARLAGVFLTSFGGGFMIGGAALAGDAREPREKQNFGQAAAAVGAATLVLGVVVLVASRPVRRSGATTEIVLPRPSPPVVSEDATEALLGR